MAVEDDPRMPKVVSFSGRSGFKPDDGFEFINVKSLVDNPISVPWLIKGLIEDKGVHLMVGAYGTGKSFCAFDMAFCIAAGIDWHGFKVKQRPVAIICGEGHSSIGHRFDALSRHYGIDCPENIFVSKMPARLTDTPNADMVEAAVANIAPNAFVLIDTLNRNFGEGDENSTKDMTKFMANIDRYFRGTEKTVLIVHHSGHGDQTRGRGNSSLPAACEGEFIISALDGGGMSMEVKRIKNAETPKEVMNFVFKKIYLGIYDEDGEEASTLVLVEGEATGQPEGQRDKKIKNLSARDRAVLNALHKATHEHGIDPPEGIKSQYAGFDTFIGSIQKIVSIHHWRNEAYQIVSVDSDQDDKKADAVKKAFSRARKTLFNKGLTQEHGDYVWRIFE